MRRDTRPLVRDLQVRMEAEEVDWPAFAEATVEAAGVVHVSRIENTQVVGLTAFDQTIETNEANDATHWTYV